MGDDFTFFVPPATTTPPAAAAAPQPSAAAAAGRAVPRCRRHVHFPDFPSSAIWLPPAPADDDDDTSVAEEAEPEKATATGEVEDRMDLLWEDFNEELLAMRRAGGPAAESSSSDGEYSDSAGRAPYAGCFPVLRSSARAGGAGHYYYCRRRRRAGTWVLLMKIFRRLFVIDKTIYAAGASSRHSTTSS